MARKNKRILHQRYSDDCGIACLAMLLGIPYGPMRTIVLESLNLLGYDEFNGLVYQQARLVAASVGEKLHSRIITDQNREHYAQVLRDGTPAILVCPANSPHPDYIGEYHAVYWDGERLHDPNPTKRPINRWRGKYGAGGIKAIKTMAEMWYLHEDLI